jgi:hypothetical protein
MELLIAVALLVGLGLLAARVGVDSRDSAGAVEERLAGFGMTWDGAPTDRRLTDGRPAPPRRRAHRPPWVDLTRETVRR